MDGYRGSETRTSSDASELTGDEKGEVAQKDLEVPETMPAEWTDEKHNRYLNSMEASFANQLYNSLDLLGRHSQKEMPSQNLSQQLNCSTCILSGQFKVLRHGSWNKVNFQRPELQRGSRNESRGFLRSPWIQHFRSGGKPQIGAAGSRSQTNNSHGKQAMQCGSASRPRHSRTCYSCSYNHDVDDCRTEMSGQNFVDDDTKDEGTSSTCSWKRMKTLITDASCSDQ